MRGEVRFQESEYLNQYDLAAAYMAGYRSAARSRKKANLVTCPDCYLTFVPKL